MTRKLSLKLLLSVLLLFFYNHQLAYALNAFKISGIKVSIVSDSLDNAKNEAWEVAGKEAFRLLLQRLLPVESHSRISYLKVELQNCISEVIPSNERMTSESYAADIDFVFDPISIKRYLNKAGIFYTDKFSEPYLIIPVIKKGSNVSVWEDQEWFSAWDELPEISGMSRFEFLNADLLDIALLKIKELSKLSYTDLKKLSTRYAAKDFIVCFAIEDDKKIKITMRHISEDLDREILSISRDIDYSINPQEFYHKIALDLQGKIDSYYKSYKDMTLNS